MEEKAIDRQDALARMLDRVADLIDEETREHGFINLEVVGVLECLKAHIINRSYMEEASHG